MPSPVIIGRILATEKAPTTIDNFAFWTNPSLILNPFDIVKVEHVNGSFSYGMIEDISHITDAASFLTNYNFERFWRCRSRISDFASWNELCSGKGSM